MASTTTTNEQHSTLFVKIGLENGRDINAESWHNIDFSLCERLIHM